VDRQFRASPGRPGARFVTFHPYVGSFVKSERFDRVAMHVSPAHSGRPRRRPTQPQLTFAGDANRSKGLAVTFAAA
jgi:hypothetical protein